MEVPMSQQEAHADSASVQLSGVLRYSQALMEAVDRHALVSITDLAGDITYANATFCSISGYRLDELLGSNHRLLRSGQHAPEFYHDLWNTISSGGIWQGEICNRRRDGTLYWVESTITPFLDSEGEIYQYVSIRTDITHVKSAQAECVAARQEAERANAAKSEFLAHMSHELRTPMNAILGFAQLLERSEGTASGDRDSVQEILTAGHHLLKLINELLNLSNTKSDSMPMPQDLTDTHEPQMHRGSHAP